MKPITDESIKHFVDTHFDDSIELLKTLCGIPAPSNHEEKRAEFCKKWLMDHGAKEVYIDSALNTVFPMGCEKDEPVLVLMAHTDTVFPDMEPMPIEIRDGKMFCPGVMDDTANVVVLLMLVKFVLQHKLKFPFGIVFAANSGEEGLGNLKGSRQLVKDYGSRMMECISLDGTYSHISNKGVGSTRYKVEVKTEGGHSYGNFGNRNAIHYLSQMISDLYTMKVPQEDGSKTTYNVGGISGGTSVNTIAQHAEMLYEYRSDSLACLEKMKQFFDSVITHYNTMGIDVGVEVIGSRPCSGYIDPERQRALEDRFYAVAAEVLEKKPEAGSGSTDCNIPWSQGIPGIVFGCCAGEGAHTREEYMEIESLKTGMTLAIKFMLSYL